MRLLEARIPLTLLLDLAPAGGPPSEAIMRLEQRKSPESRQGSGAAADATVTG